MIPKNVKRYGLWKRGADDAWYCNAGIFSVKRVAWEHCGHEIGCGHEPGCPNAHKELT